MVTASVWNSTSEERTIQVTVVPTSIHIGLTEAHLFNQHLTLRAFGTEENSATSTDGFKAQNALAHVELPPKGVIEQYTYTPDCTGSDDPESEIRIGLDSVNSASFAQNSCHGE